MAPAPIPTGLTFLNGLGGFAQDGSYVVVLDPSATTPAPWVNLLANPANAGASDAFFQRVLALIGTSSDTAPPDAIDDIAVTTPETIEPAPL